MSTLSHLKRGAMIAGAAVLLSSCGDPKAGESCSEPEQVCTEERRILACQGGKWVDQGVTIDQATCDCTNSNDCPIVD